MESWAVEGQAVDDQAVEGWAVEFGFVALGLERMISMIDPRNLRSIRVAEKIGLHYEKDADCGGYVDRIYVTERRDIAW